MGSLHGIETNEYDSITNAWNDLTNRGWDKSSDRSVLTAYSKAEDKRNGA